VAAGQPAWQVGHLAELSPTMLSHICSGRRAVSVEEATRLSRVLGVDAATIFPELLAIG
jgi:plasmid maintenance system antidote protein VapI